MTTQSIKDLFSDYEQSGPPWSDILRKDQYEAIRKWLLPRIEAQQQTTNLPRVAQEYQSLLDLCDHPDATVNGLKAVIEGRLAGFTSLKDRKG